MGINRPLLSGLLKCRVCGFYRHLIFPVSGQYFGTRWSGALGIDYTERMTVVVEEYVFERLGM